MDKALHAIMLNNELQWLCTVIDFRMKSYFNHKADYEKLKDINPPALLEESYYAQIVNRFNMNFEERLILILTLAPHLRPQILDVFFLKNSNHDRVFTEFGGVKSQNFSGFLPTGETAAFILCGDDIQQRLELLTCFGEEHFFKTQNIISLVYDQPDEPMFSGALRITNEYVNNFCNGLTKIPPYSTQFPARKLSSTLNWEDLILDNHTINELEEIIDWIKFSPCLLNDWEMFSKIKPGFRVLFYGRPGTGKLLAATLIGKSVGMDVYRVDLSMLVSKFIGETEKNLACIFDQAKIKNWILYFDEADALFGKQTQRSSSNDRSSYQEISYLLDRIENYAGIVILAKNLKENTNDILSHKFQLIIDFAMPNPEQREKLWIQSFSKVSTLEKSINIHEISEKYELTGGSIINIVRYCSIEALKRNETIILLKDLMVGIRKEFTKNGKSAN
jgi:hypothetical protein